MPIMYTLIHLGAKHYALEADMSISSISIDLPDANFPDLSKILPLDVSVSLEL